MNMDIAHFRERITRLTPINTLSEQNLRALFDSMQLIQLSRGEKLFHEGQEDKSHFYLLQGAISIRSMLSAPKIIQADSPEALLPLDHYQPRKHSATAKTDAICLKIDSPSLEMMLSWQQSGDYEVEEITPESVFSANDWMGKLLKNAILQQLPPHRIQQMFEKLVAENYNAGDMIIRQGEPGEDFFVLSSGRAAVLRSTPSSPQGTPVAQLFPGDTFGEDALLSREPRNASIQAIENCQVMRMTKADFEAIIEQQVPRSMDFMEAADLVSRNKARWIDVRPPNEFGQHHLDKAINLPLLFLRLKLNQLDRNYHYVVCCEDGSKSRAGAYLLNKHGIDAHVLEGGLASAR